MSQLRRSIRMRVSSSFSPEQKHSCGACSVSGHESAVFRYEYRKPIRFGFGHLFRISRKCCFPRFTGFVTLVLLKLCLRSSEFQYPRACLSHFAILCTIAYIWYAPLFEFEYNTFGLVLIVSLPRFELLREWLAHFSVLQITLAKLHSTVVITRGYFFCWVG